MSNSLIVNQSLNLKGRVNLSGAKNAVLVEMAATLLADGVSISKSTAGSGYISSVRPNVAWDPLAIQASTFSFNPSGGTSILYAN